MARLSIAKPAAPSRLVNPQANRAIKRLEKHPPKPLGPLMPSVRGPLASPKAVKILPLLWASPIAKRIKRAAPRRMPPGRAPAGRNQNRQCKARLDRRFLGRITGLAWRTRAEDQGDVGLFKISGLKFFKEVAFARGPDDRPCCFSRFWMHIWIDPHQGDGCPYDQCVWAVCSCRIFGALLQTCKTAKAISSLISA